MGYMKLAEEDECFHEWGLESIGSMISELTVKVSLIDP